MDDGAQEVMRPKAIRKAIKALEEDKQQLTESENEDSDSDDVSSSTGSSMEEKG